MLVLSKYLSFQPRVAPPSYEEALSSRMLTSLRLGPGGFRSLSEDRATNHPSPPPPFRGRNSSGNIRMPLTRSSRVEEIPDIYWEQAARELDFCTCRKCQVRTLLFFLLSQLASDYFFLLYKRLIMFIACLRMED